MSHCDVFISGLLWNDYYPSTKTTSHHKENLELIFLDFSHFKSHFWYIFTWEKNNALIPDQEYTYLKTLIPEAVGGIELLRRF